MTKPPIAERLGTLLSAPLIALGAFTWVSSAAGQMLQQPLQTGGGGTPPNLMFTLDDSGSMWWECLPDDLCAPGSYGLEAIPRLDASALGNGNRLGTIVYDDVDVTHTTGSGNNQKTVTDWSSKALLLSRQMRSSAYNPLYYNPAVQYLPWLKSDGTRWPNSNPTAAPVLAGATQTQNLVGAQTISANKWCWATSTQTNTSSCADSTTQTAVIARYYNMAGDGSKVSHFELVTIIAATNSYPKGAGRADCAGTTCTYNEEIQNFANWYTYYRTRALTAIGGTAEAFAAVPADFRVGYGRINKKSGTVDGVSTSTLERGVRAFSGSDKSDFYGWLAGRTRPGGGTPLLSALDAVGQYFSRKDNGGPWGSNPGTNDTSPHSACRRSFHVLMTDGMWNNDSAGTPGATGNVDGSAGSTITGPGGQTYTYQPSAPYSDKWSGTLADVAMYYWKNDLRPDLQNAIKPVTKPGQEDPAFWQHLVNYAIAFGVDGTLNNPGDLPALKSGSKSWPDPSKNGNTPAAVDDLWHAAINSRGRLLSARNSTEYSNALRSIIADVINFEGSEAGLGVSNVTLPSVGSSTKIYTPSFSSPDWSGQVQAQVIDSSGVPTGVAWTSAIPEPASRSVFTYDPDAAGGPKVVPFQWSSLSTTAKTALWGSAAGGESLVNYLRGDSSGEGTVYRERKSRLGDIVNSTPALVFNLVNYSYQYLPAKTASADYGAETYARFLRAKSLRTAQLVVGANDGMLHAFNDDDGIESFAFMPRSVLNSIRQTSNQDYTHRYFVDGPIHETDVYDAVNRRWNNLVQGFGGAGGKYLYSIRMPVVDWTSGSEPSPLTKAQSTPGAADIWWEINSVSAGFEEMGYIITKPETGLTRDGAWVTIFGNGYESKSGKAQLFIVDAMTGSLIKKIDTGVGSPSSPNGLGGIGVVRDGHQRIVAAYGGDLQGNMWKFDLSSATTSGWAVAFGGQPLVTVKNSSNQPEPISAKPNFRAFPTSGVMVLFGTGKLFQQGDEKDTGARTLYGIWDRVAVGGGPGTVADTVTSLALLSTQKAVVDPIPNSVGATYRRLLVAAVDYKTQRGWRLPLVIAEGERSIDQPQVRFDSVLMQTVTPTDVDDDCQAAKLIRRGYLLDPFMSGTQAPPFDGDANGTTESHIVDLTGSGENQLVMQTPICLGSQCESNGGNDPPCTGLACNRIRCPKSGVILGAGAKGGIEACFGSGSIRRYWREIVTPPQS